MKIMLVDDEEWCVEELKEILSGKDGVCITGAYTVASEALEAAIRDGPDMIFLDVQMPVITGLELAQKIKSQLPEIHVVLMSEKECYARNGFDIGVDDYVLKPLRRERVLGALKRIKRKEL